MSRSDARLFGIAAAPPFAILAYAALRAVERVFYPEPNPAMLLWSDRSPFLWRGAIALYLGGAAAFGGYALARRASAHAPSVLRAAVLAAAVAIVLQAALWP